MIILSVKTSHEIAELKIYNEQKQLLAERKWQAHRDLSSTIHVKLKELLTEANKTLHNIDALILFKGPGSFTGLRIGAAFVNAFALGNKCKLASASGKNWEVKAINSILEGKNDKVVLPKYGAKPKITKPRK